MPIDILSVFNKTTSHLANKSVIGYVFGHPVWCACIVVVCIVLILQLWGDKKKDFKFWFYLMGLMLGILITHDVIMIDQIKETMETSANTSLVNDVHALGSIQPSLVPRVLGGKSEPQGVDILDSL